MISGFTYQFLTLILSFVARTVFIHTLGAEYLGLNGIWISIPCADTIACFVTVWVYLTYRQRLKIVMGAI